VSDAVDLVSNSGDYLSEVVSLQGTLVSAFGYAGPGYRSAQISTSAIADEPNLVLRLPKALPGEIDLVEGCTFSLNYGVIWRHNETVQPSAWEAGNLALTSCPAPMVVSAVSNGQNTVVINFDRHISADSVEKDGSQFTFDGGLTVSSVGMVAETSITLATSDQAPGQSYKVTVAGSVTDTLEAGVDAEGNTAIFEGFSTQAKVLISELNANISNGCDLIEFLVTEGGSMDGFEVYARTTSIATFSGLVVETGDIIVLHVDSGDDKCNPTGSVSEAVAKDEQANSAHDANYDSAYDWYTDVEGLIATNNVITIYNSLGVVVDAVLVTKDATGSAAAVASETQAAELAKLGEWLTVEGTVPAGGFVDESFNANAVAGLKAAGSSAKEGPSIQRNGSNDSNSKADWFVVNSSFGVANPEGP
jgi:hypothetical protein